MPSDLLDADTLIHLLDGPSRFQAYEQLRVMAHSAAPALVAGLRHQSATVRSLAVELLSKLRDRGFTPALVAALADPSTFVRRSAVEGLGRLRDPQSIDALVAAASDPDGVVRLGALTVLGRIRQSRALELMPAFLDDREQSVRDGACCILEHLSSVKPERLAPLLAHAMRDQDPRVRSTAIRVAGLRLRLGLIRASLLQAATDPEDYVASAAKYVLKYLETHAD